MALGFQNMKLAVKTIMKAHNVPNIVGPAGIGKSALVAEVADDLHAKLFTTVVSLSEKGDLAIPVPPIRQESFVKTTQYGTLANVKYGYSETLINIIQAAEHRPDQPIIWFLDEFNRGTAAVQSELMNLVLQRQVNSLRLPSQVSIVIAENPDETMEGFADADYAVTPGDAALKDRTVRLVMETNLKDWLTWAQQENEEGRANIEPIIQQYLSDHPNFLNGPVNEDLYPTPRAWQRVSENLVQLTSVPDDIRQVIMPDIFSGDLGSEVGVAFSEYVINHGNTLTSEKLVSRPINQVMGSFNKLSDGDKVALVNSLVAKNVNNFSDIQFISRLCECLENLSKDGQYAVVQDLGKLNHTHPSLLQSVYNQAKNGEPQAQKLYQLIQQIALM